MVRMPVFWLRGKVKFSLPPWVPKVSSSSSGSQNTLVRSRMYSPSSFMLTIAGGSTIQTRRLGMRMSISYLQLLTSLPLV
jgi:hypothetical protein